MKYYTIYKTVNKINGKIYIGKHQCEDPFDNYMGSGTLLKRAINKHGINNFEKTVLYIFDNEEEMNKKEIEIINGEFILREDTYNIGLGGQGGKLLLDYTHSEETRDKIRKSSIGSKKNLSDSQRKLMGERTILIHSGSKRSLESKEKMRMSQLGKTKSLDERNKIREGVLNSMPSYTCPVCNKTGKCGAMKAYHFNNCKFNKS
jgi:group I intron endonuclease